MHRKPNKMNWVTLVHILLCDQEYLLSQQLFRLSIQVWEFCFTNFNQVVTITNISCNYPKFLGPWPFIELNCVASMFQIHKCDTISVWFDCLLNFRPHFYFLFVRLSTITSFWNCWCLTYLLARFVPLHLLNGLNILLEL